MRLNPTIAALAAGVFAVLLLIYVFAGESSQTANPDRLSETQISGGPKREEATPCWSQGTSDQIKNELFRRAAIERASDAGIFRSVAALSSVRVANPKTVKHEEASATIMCAASVAVALPQGLTVVGGSQALAGDVTYAIQRSAGTGSATLIVTDGDAITGPLSTLSRSAPDDQSIEAGENDQDSTEAAPVVELRPQAVPRQIEPRPQPVPRVREAPRRAEAKPAPPRQRITQTRTTPTRTAEVPPRTAIERPAPATSPPVRTASPSFNCRSARTRSEIAVCRNNNLAGLDRQMAAQFNSAARAADRGKKAQLERSRNQFLRYRDSCSTQACIAGAYRDRMREIDDIMNERWSPR